MSGGCPAKRNRSRSGDRAAAYRFGAVCDGEGWGKIAGEGLVEGVVAVQTMFILGTAGSGKSSLTAALYEWLRDQGQSSMTVNLDPAAVALPYDPDLDIREAVDYDRVMAQMGLGPNAALIRSVREVARNIEELRREMESSGVDFALVDTPGQLELFAFRKEGRLICENLAPPPKGSLFLFDPEFCGTPQNFAVDMFLAASVNLSINLPMILVLSKSDTVPRRELKKIMDWMADEEAFILEIENSLKGRDLDMSLEVASAVHSLAGQFPLIPVSATEFKGLTRLLALATRMLGEGELELR